MKKCLIIFEKIFQIILILIIIVNLMSIVSVKILKNKYPIIFGYSYFSVISGSMEPTIKIGDEIIVKITSDIKENDIIIYEEEGSFVTHRLIQINGNNIVTKGDANNSIDSPIGKDKVLGKVICILPFMGKIKYVITNIYFIIALIVAYIIYCILISKEK